jgi:hypothetical protein
MSFDYRKLEQRIKKNESFATTGFINEDNIFLALELKGKHIGSTDEILTCIEQLDRLKKIPEATRILAINKSFGNSFLYKYIFVTENYKVNIRENSVIADFELDNYRIRVGLEAFINVLHNYECDHENILFYLIAKQKDILDWHYENVALEDTEGLLKEILERYDNCLKEV